ncbi:MAG TPA: S-methyl-5-thioribose-1-phosphate isomerase [Phycisphaerae bacterium]|nr:S-methyl-5-thioribose-1-phosphate isomerase [Phycisphaerae bacterium]HOJ53148.1 S-methyl-5-thioribose-1-phosphate isomerase [Phycisphaerae bacterium]HOL24885.1 S-methyl-5-thioribose-1-phosphate isomerase [Phycisphaerae bacterium]HPP19421.1 S-methyl-5-thioribose-1-phosphate isomerase [Phycisphaerae bacterium]HPU32122.1 S-methyl-5-thioribose-1-phosphate isomerase [Phycisphaerae bacterium]
MSETLLPKTICWVGGLDGWIEMIDQTLLPGELKVLACHDVETLWEAIRNLRVRGAPAIGIAAAMGVVLGIRDSRSSGEFFDNLAGVCSYLAGSRPTAVNLFWALDRMRARAEALRGADLKVLKQAMLAEAQAIRDEDAATCRAIGEVGQSLIADGAVLVTHCNAGGLATSEYGTALAPMFRAHELGRRFKVYADETRPLLQGSRLTAWELARAGIDVTILCDNMVGHLMSRTQVSLVITGADRIASNGDTANKIGTYGLAILAKAHNVPFYVAAPRSTFDRTLADGSMIPIEERPADEVRKGFGRLTAPEGVACYNPAFDVTPAALIRGIITEVGLVSPVTPGNIRKIFTDEACNEPERR